MELKAIEPTHCGLSRIGDALEHLVAVDTLVPADPYGRGVYKGNPCAPAHAAGLKEHGHWHEVGLHELGEPAVGNGLGEFPLHMYLDIINVKVLKSPEASQMEEHGNGDDLALGHPWRALWGIAQHCPIDYLVIFFAKFIDNTK